MTYCFHIITSLMLFIATAVTAWKAVPANQAMYALRARHYPPANKSAILTADELLPRTYIHSIFKFGWCTPDSTQRQFLSRETNITLSDWQSAQATYVYLIEDGDTQNFALQCVVMKIMVPRIHLFRRSRIPVYYCQGYLFYVWKLTYTRLEIHEFYLYYPLNLPANILFEFYHPLIL